VTDQLSLSIWLNRNGRTNRVRQFEKLLRLFPFSHRPQPQSSISIHAISSTEPPLLEKPVNGPVDIAEIMMVLQEYAGDDIACRVDTWWDLWRYEQEWAISPSRVSLSCFGPEFDNGTELDTADQEDLRIDFGLDSKFLPQPNVPGSAKLVEANVKSLLRLVHELDSALAVQTRRLETESGENFADRLQHALTESYIQ